MMMLHAIKIPEGEKGHDKLHQLRVQLKEVAIQQAAISEAWAA